MPVVTSQDWLDALGILHRAVSQSILQKVFNQVTTIQYSNRISNAHGILSASGYVLINAKVEHAAKIERVEVLLALSCWLAKAAHEGMSMFEYRKLTEKVGCCIGTTADIRERWRLIDYATPLHLLPLAVFEDRAKCKMCKSPVATGAGAWIKGVANNVGGGPQLAIGSEIEWWNALSYDQQEAATEMYLHYKPDVHEECMRYAHTVLVPLRKAQMQAEALKGTAAIDK